MSILVDKQPASRPHEPLPIKDGEDRITTSIKAAEALEVLGRMCLSIIPPSLQLYFKTSELQLDVKR